MEKYEYEIDTIKIEKLKAMRRYRTFKNIANIVKTLEVFVAVMIVFWSVSWSSAYVPTAVNLIGASLRRLSTLLFSPHFVFLVGNAIVITLFVKSGNQVTSSVSESTAGDILSGEVPAVEVKVPPPPPDTAAEVAEVEVKEVEEREKEVAVAVETVEAEEKVYRRSQSSVEMVVVKAAEEKEKKQLRRSATEPRRKIGNREALAARRRRMCEEDDLSGEEFRKTVEAFIEKQKRFLRQESQAVVLRNL